MVCTHGADCIDTHACAEFYICCMVWGVCTRAFASTRLKATLEGFDAGWLRVSCILYTDNAKTGCMLPMYALLPLLFCK